MCVSFSGRCLISHYLTGRDSNRGNCAQPCRWNYRVVEEKRPGQYYPVEEEDGKTFLFNAKDLCMISHLDRLAQAGITSFKIEGRAKSAYYTAVVTGAYRQALDLYGRDPEHFELPSWLKEEVEKVSHRAYCTGFYFGPIQNGQNLENGGYLREWEVMGVVGSGRTERPTVSSGGNSPPGIPWKWCPPGKKPYPLLVEALWDGQGQPIPSTNHAAMDFSLPCKREITPGSLLRKQM